ncbi:MAG: hypothetical protein ACOX6J_04515 [Oscillospiraceae bacterium]|jgi:hypothetical protein
MRRKFRIKAISALLAACLAILLTGCYNPSTVMTVGDTEVKCGTYLISQLAAADDAVSTLNSRDSASYTLDEAMSLTIDDMSFTDYVREQTIETCKKYVFTENEFSKYGLELDSTVTYYYDLYCQNQWSTYSSFYTSNGISYETFLDNTLNSYKYSQLFEYLYLDPESDKCISDEELSSCFTENYRKISYIKFPDANNDSSEFSTDQLQELESLADTFVEELNSGTSMSDLFNSMYDQALAIGNYTITHSDSVAQSNLTEDSIVSTLTTSEDSVMLEEVLSKDPGTNGWVMGSNGVIYVYSVGEHVVDGTEWESYKSDLAQILRSDDFDQYTQEGIDALEATVDEKAADYYSVSKIVSTSN